MTNTSDQRHTMKMLAKVARGLDLPPPDAAIPPQAAAPLADDKSDADQWLDETVAEAKTTGGTASDPAGGPLTQLSGGNQHPWETIPADRGAESSSGRPTAASDPAAPPESTAADFQANLRSAPGNTGPVGPPSVSIPADIAAAKTSPQLPLPEEGNRKASGLPTAAPAPAIPPESSTKPGLPATVAGPGRSARGGQVRTQPEPDPLPDAEDAPAMADKPAKPSVRWQLYRAGKPGSKASRPAAGMLQPVFDNPDQADAAPPAGIQKRADTLARDRSPAARRQPDSAAASSTLTTRTAQEQAAPRAARQAPAGDQKAPLHLSSPRPAAEQPRPELQPSATPGRPRPTRPPNRRIASVGQTLPGKPAAVSGPGQAATSAATQDRPGAKTDGVSIGRINIQVRGPRQAEEDWPEPPQYTSHSITADWEWSCHYGK